MSSPLDRLSTLPGSNELDGDSARVTTDSLIRIVGALTAPNLNKLENGICQILWEAKRPRRANAILLELSLRGLPSCESTVKSTLAAMVRCGYLTTDRRPGGGYRLANQFPWHQLFGQSIGR
jgi:hypothetical protein